jgi:iron complex transport system ATP-binding protein
MADAVLLDGASVRTREGTVLLGPVDLCVRVGERWAILGPNGSGKTTLLSLAGGRRQPSAGTVTVLGGGFGVTDMRQPRRRIGHAGHRLAEAIRPSMAVLDVVLTGRDSVLESWTLEESADDRAEAERSLVQVGCAALSQRGLGTLSQGERQRVLLARALFGGPDLLVLDEPAAGLDLPSREALVSAMETVEGATVLLATHHLEELPSTITHAALLRDGRLVAAGPADDVLRPEPLSACFGVPLDVARRNGRWSAAAVREG